MNVAGRTRAQLLGLELVQVLGLLVTLLLAGTVQATAQQKESHLDRVVKAQKLRVCVGRNTTQSLTRTRARDSSRASTSTSPRSWQAN